MSGSLLQRVCIKIHMPVLYQMLIFICPLLLLNFTKLWIISYLKMFFCPPRCINNLTNFIFTKPLISWLWHISYKNVIPLWYTYISLQKLIISCHFPVKLPFLCLFVPLNCGNVLFQCTSLQIKYLFQKNFLNRQVHRMELFRWSRNFSRRIIAILTIGLTVLTINFSAKWHTGRCCYILLAYSLAYFYFESWNFQQFYVLRFTYR